jgi:hypothetical protein
MPEYKTNTFKERSTKGHNHRPHDREKWDKSKLWDNIGPDAKKSKSKPKGNK